jgi:hypothetical protein
MSTRIYLVTDVETNKHHLIHAGNQAQAMPFGNDTKVSFSIYFQQMMKVDADEIKAGMQ